MRNLWRFNSKLAWCVVALIFGIVGPARAQVGPQSVFLEVRTPQFDLTVNSTGAPSSGTCTDLTSERFSHTVEIVALEGYATGVLFTAKCHFVNIEYYVDFETTRTELIDNVYRPTHVKVTIKVAFTRDDFPDDDRLYVLNHPEEVEITSRWSGFYFNEPWFTHYPGVLFHKLRADMFPLL